MLHSSKLHAKLVSFQSTDELKRKARKSQRRGSWRMGSHFRRLTDEFWDLNDRRMSELLAQDRLDKAHQSEFNGPWEPEQRGPWEQGAVYE